MRDLHRLTVEAEGTVILPESVRLRLDLRPGDLLSVEGRSPVSFKLEIYREFLTLGPTLMDRSALQGFVLRFLAHQLTTVEEGGRVRIPPEAFPISTGRPLTLEVTGSGGWHELGFYLGGTGPGQD